MDMTQTTHATWIIIISKACLAAADAIRHACARMQSMNAPATAGYMVVTCFPLHIIGSHEPGSEQGQLAF